ncbi:MAG: hypothetical protein H6831_08245 [Planctomycetes bacterium]|nr:hypothetical protein [Planctomycetota bacterium]
MRTTNARFLLGILLGFLLGGGSAALFLDDHADAIVELSGSAAPDAAPTKAETAALASPTTTRAAERREVEDVPAAARVSDAKVRELAQGVSGIRSERKPGTGVIHGRVVDENGAGLAGVVVRLELTRPIQAKNRSLGVGEGAPEWESLDDVVRIAAERFEEERANRREQVSAADGSYRFEGLSSDTWFLRGYAAGYEISVVAGNAYVVPDLELDLTARHVVPVPVEVIAADGASASGAELVARSSGQDGKNLVFEWSPEDRLMRVPPGDYTVYAQSMEKNARGRPESKSEALEVSFADTPNQPALRFELRTSLGIRGRVALPNGDLGPGTLVVHLKALSESDSEDEDALAEALKSSDERDFCRAGNLFQFDELAPGRYAVGVARDFRGEIAVHRVVEVVDGVVQCDLDLPPVDLGRALLVTVLDSAGGMVDGANLSVREKGGRDARFYMLASSNLVRTANGQYVVEIPKEVADDYFGGAAGEKRYALNLNHGDYGRREWDLARGTTELTVTLESPASLTVTVPGYRGSEYAGRLSLSIENVTPGASNQSYVSRTRGKLDADGTGQFTALEPGAYRLSLTLTPQEPSTTYSRETEIDLLELELGSGENSAQLNIPALYALRVHWADGKAGNRMSLESTDETKSRRRAPYAGLDADGYATFHDITAGDYVLIAGGGTSSQRMFVTVPSKLVEFVPIAVDALRVEITDPAGNFAKLGLETGDLIIGVDGTEFSEPPSSSIFNAVNNSKSARLSLLVERAGKRLELTVRGSDLGQWGERGAEFVPVQR